MGKKPSDNKKKGGKKLGKPGSKGRQIDEKAKNSKKKTQKVYFPAVIVQPEPEAEPSEHELSYKDLLLATEMEKLAAKGLNNEEIIRELGISRDTFYRKLREESYFSYGLFKHRNIANHNVENALYKRSTGYTFLEKTTEAKPVITYDAEGNKQVSYQLMTAKVVEKEVPGDVKAQEFWLTNRKPEEWKKKIEPMQEKGADMSRITFALKKRAEL